MFPAQYADRTNPMDKHVQLVMDTRGMEATPFTPQIFGNAGLEHMEKYGMYVFGNSIGSVHYELYIKM